MQERAKLWLRPALGPLKSLVDVLRNLPWPKPLQRLTARGLERLTARIPELADLLGQTPAVFRPGRTPAPGQTPAAKTRQAPPSSGSLDELIGQLDARDFRARLKAVQALAHHPSERSAQALIGALRDRSVEVAVDAVHSLASIAGSEARATLREVLENPEGFYHPLVRAAAVHALGKLALGADAARIVQALSDADAEVSIAAIAALVVGAPEQASGALLRVVANPEGFFLPVTRLAAARGLERLPPVGIEQLASLLDAETDAEVAESLRRLANLGP
jgi:HEAT repeat protein